MFEGYSFFDYKYNIEGYSGQDYDGFGRPLYMGLSLFFLVVVAIIFRKAKKENILKYLRISGIVYIIFYIVKTVWESYFDITTGRGFNVYILPFDTCSIVMLASVLAGFSKGKVKDAATGWLVVGGIVGGLSNIFFLRALNYYPFFTFGALYSMLWHFFMTFTGVLLIITDYVKLDFKTIFYAFIFHLSYSIPVIILDYVYGWDYMLYYNAGGAPFIEDVASNLINNNLRFVVTLMMIMIYFALFATIIYASYGIKRTIKSIKHKKQEEIAYNQE